MSLDVKIQPAKTNQQIYPFYESGFVFDQHAQLDSYYDIV